MSRKRIFINAFYLPVFERNCKKQGWCGGALKMNEQGDIIGKFFYK